MDRTEILRADQLTEGRQVLIGIVEHRIVEITTAHSFIVATTDLGARYAWKPDTPIRALSLHTCHICTDLTEAERNLRSIVCWRFDRRADLISHLSEDHQIDPATLPAPQAPPADPWW